MARTIGSGGGPYPQSNQKKPLGRPVKLADTGQQVRPGPPRHLLPSQHDANQAPVIVEVGEQAERIIAGISANDLIIRPVPLAQLSRDHASRPRIVIDNQQHWSISHRPHPMSWL
jgi:hypothetical protein